MGAQKARIQMEMDKATRTLDSMYFGASTVKSTVVRCESGPFKRATVSV